MVGRQPVIMTRLASRRLLGRLVSIVQAVSLHVRRFVCVRVGEVVLSLTGLL
jgi:hypothetical protein